MVSHEEQNIRIYRWCPPNANSEQPSQNEWQHEEVLRPHQFHGAKFDWERFCSTCPVTYILASAKEIRKCQQCRETLQAAFRMPKLWWTDNLKRSNGHFGCEAESSGRERADKSQLTTSALNTWVFFEVKHVKNANFNKNGELDYWWEKTNVFTRWLGSSQQMAILVFDNPAAPSQPDAALEFSPHDPFWIYSGICEAIARQQDAAVWSIRNSIRQVEKEKEVTEDSKPNPQFRLLHHVARHAAHVTESLDVAVRTMDNILLQHECFREEQRQVDAQDWRTVHNRFRLVQQLIGNLRHRSVSNEKRLANEMQLAFGTVAQYDSGLSVLISRATRADSAAMKTVASLTLVFLPPTFISSLFSMSFFNMSEPGGWHMSSKFWIYWVFTIPLTVLTSVFWRLWLKSAKEEDSQIGLMRRETEGIWPGPHSAKQKMDKCLV